MNQNEAFELLKRKHFIAWNQYRKTTPDWIPDLSNLDLSNLDFIDGDAIPDLSRTILCGCILPHKNSFRNRYRKTNLEDAIYDLKTKSSFDPAAFGAVFVTEEQQSRLGTAKQTTVFISYAWANQDVIVAIDFWLRQKGLNVQLDQRDFFAGSRIRDEILRTMKESDVVLIFHSKESKNKPWPIFEQELAADLEMTAKVEGKVPPRIMYIVIDDTPLPSITESNKISVMAKGKKFEPVCEEIYRNILLVPHSSEPMNLEKWKDYTF